jgi:RNA polymerase sigma-70 factor (ECF subfamily)
MADEARSSARQRDRENDTSQPASPATGMAEGFPDAELARRVRDADGAALSQLYQRFVRPYYSLARRICADEGRPRRGAGGIFLTLWRDPTRVTPRGATSSPGCSR